jgi:enamine deaminase RidA (YjgF/YER057c/UK114 family)
MRNLLDNLEEARMTLDEVPDTTVCLDDLPDVSAFDEAQAKYFGRKHASAHSTKGITFPGWSKCR